MDSGFEHGSGFSEAISFIVPCDEQEEIDCYWEKLSAHPNAGQFGWLQDEYGLSWQISPIILSQLMSSQNEQRVARVTQAFLKMKKYDIAALQRLMMDREEESVAQRLRPSDSVACRQIQRQRPRRTLS